MGDLTLDVVGESEKQEIFEKELQQAADELRALDRAGYNATLEKGRLLARFQEEGLYRRDPSYRPGDYKKAKDGARAATAAWARREVGPHFSSGRVSQLVTAHHVVTVVTTASPAVEPTSERQLRPLARLWPEFKDKIPEAWEAAVEAVGGNQPGQGEVSRAAREAAPDAFPRKKRKPSARAALKALVDQYGRKALEAAWKDMR